MCLLRRDPSAKELLTLNSDAGVRLCALIASAKSAFDFLEDSATGVKVDDDPDRTVLGYVLGEAAFEIELDWREQCVSILFCRTVDGKRPPGYYAHEDRRVRVHLAYVLGKYGDSDRADAKELKEATRRSGLEAMASQVSVLASTLRRRLDDVLGRCPPPGLLSAGARAAGIGRPH